MLIVLGHSPLTHKPKVPQTNNVTNDKSSRNVVTQQTNRFSNRLSLKHAIGVARALSLNYN